MGALEAIILTIITAATPLLLAAIGELVVERSGVLNLGVEGMMVVGAVCAFAGAQVTGLALVGVAAGAVAGLAMALLFAVLTQSLITNQVATGLALTLLGLGLSGLIGEDFTGLPGVKLAALSIPGVSDLPVIGPILFGQDILVYGSFLAVAGVAYTLNHSRLGLIIRAVGDNHHSAHALGYSVIGVRYGCILFGGLCAGLSGAYLSLAYTPQWIENMTGGRGWIALALVVFATWLPVRALIGRLSIRRGLDHGFICTGLRFRVTFTVLSSLPYLVTIAALVVISRNRATAKVNTPACIGIPFVPDR